MIEIIPSSLVKRGMFVAALDRPWLGTPFLLEGFLVDDDSQIEDLQKLCSTVTIDRSRSIGAHYAAEGSARAAALRRSSGPIPTPTRMTTEPDDFPLVCKILSMQDMPGHLKRGAQTVPPLGIDKQSKIETELLYSAPLIDDVKQSLRFIREASGKAIEEHIQDISSQVAEMAQSVERNPDAMIWLTRLRSSDEYSYDHAVDVSVHLMVLTRFLGMPARTIELLGLVGMLQDVGKVTIPENVLSKNDPLSDSELTLVRSHVASSMQILHGLPEFSVEALTIVGSHHERYDGSGYPRRVQGAKISLNAELAGLIDTYCAMTRQRAYRSAISSQKALESLITMRDTKFRAPIVDQLIQCIGLYPIGTLVELNSGEVAVVIQQNQVRRLKPRVMIVLGADKTNERHPRTVDLMMDPPTSTGDIYRIIRSLPADAYGIDPAEFYLG